MIIIALADGFEEIEALTPADFLRRAGAEVKTASIGAKTVVGAHGIAVEADMLFDQKTAADAELLLLPGGRGYALLEADARVRNAITEVVERGGYVAAICAAPTILARMGLLNGKNAVCFPEMKGELEGANYVDKDAVRDGRIITGRAAGGAAAFSLLIVEALQGKEEARRLAKSVHYDYY